MFKVSWRNLLANKLRLFLTVAAVTVGVSFVSGTFVLSDTMGKAFDQLYAGLTSGTDVVVRAKTAYEANVTSGVQPRPMDESIVGTVSAVPEVEAARGGVSGFALIVDKHGKPIQTGGAPTIAASVGDPRFSGAFSYRQGHAPAGPGEVAIDAGTAAKAGFHLGDKVDVIYQGGRRTFTLAGVIGFGRTDSLLGATLAAFDLPTAQEVVGKPGKVDQVDVKAVKGVSPDELRAAVADALPPGIEAVTGRQVAADGSASVRDAMGIFTKVLLVFAGVSLLVGSFVIWNTFNVLVAQRRRELALLRAVGATSRQVIEGVVAEAVLVGVVAGAIGLAAGVGLAAGIRSLLKLVGAEIPTTTPSVEPRTVVAAFAVGLVVTVVAALAPAWSTTRVSPMDALRDAVPRAEGVGPVRRWVGAALVGLGGLGLAVSAYVGNAPWWTMLSTLAAFAGLVTVGPALAQGIARLADRGPRGGGWRMAARNIARNSRRSAATALALAIGLTVVAAVAVAAASMRASVSDAVSGGNRSDLILQPAGVTGGITPAAVAPLRHRSDLADVVELRGTTVRVGGHDSSVIGIDTAGLDHVLDLGVTSGSAAALGPGTVLVDDKTARVLGVGVGDRITMTFPETGPTSLRVVGTTTRNSMIDATYLVSMADFAPNVTSQLDGAVLLKRSAGTSAAAVEKAVTSALAAYPNVTVRNPAELTRNAQHSVDQLLGLVTALLLLAVVVAILGIVNTLVLSVVERTRELGLLRAVGGTRRQVRTVVRRESVLMSLLGALTGLALGAAAGVALSRALADQGISSVSVPGPTLLVYLVVAVLVGVLAAIGPARRASRVDVLQAVTTE